VTSLADNTNPWLQCSHRSPDGRVRLLYFPHAGGSASFCFPISRILSPSIEVLALQYPGRQNRRSEPCMQNISQFVDAIMVALEEVDDRPLAFFGHSMGAILAFEVASHFQRCGRTMPVRLFASGRRAPSTTRYENVHQSDEDGLIAELRRLAGTDKRVLAEEELIRMILPPMRADYKAIETYEWMPGPPIDCPITVLVGNNDPKTTVDEARAWKKHTTRDFTMHVYPGGHFYLGGDGSGVANVIREYLQRISDPSAADEARAIHGLI
jgi:surfactin synthase thioesterase subunit